MPMTLGGEMLNLNCAKSNLDIKIADCQQLQAHQWRHHKTAQQTPATVTIRLAGWHHGRPIRSGDEKMLVS